MLTSDGYYKRKIGLGMGIQVASSLANMWLSKHVDTLKENTKWYNRYLDDIMIILKVDDTNQKLDTINRIHPKLKFTFEIETNGSIPFIDMYVPP